MKIFCPSCGVHFENEFDKTLKCDFWKLRGLDTIDNRRKKQVWNWLTSFNFDEFAIRTGYSLNVDWKGEKYNGDMFDKSVSEYKNLTEKQRREFQKQWFQFLSGAKDVELDILMQYFVQKVWKK